MKRLLITLIAAIVMLSVGSIQASEKGQMDEIFVSFNVMTAEIQFTDQVFPCQYSWQSPPFCN